VDLKNLRADRYKERAGLSGSLGHFVVPTIYSNTVAVRNIAAL
jgi:hypothetical protein